MCGEGWNSEGECVGRDGTVRESVWGGMEQ